MIELENPDVSTQPAKTPQDAQASKPVVRAAARARFADKIRSELNIEKWPAIWQPAKSKNKPALRIMEREFVGNDGSRVVSRVEVGFTQLGTLTTEEQKLLYVLIKLWEDGGKPDVQVFFSARGLARLLKKKGWGTNVIQSLTKSLRKLRTIPIEWINSYFDQTLTGAVLVDRRPFTILGDLRIVERQQDGAVNSSLGYFKFDDHILSNLLRNFTKPVCFEEFFKLNSEIAQLVYTHVDLMLFDKTKYERRTKELFDVLGLRNPEYQHMYERKRALERALIELQGIRLSSGVLHSAAIEKTKDGKDYKAVFRKSSRPDLAAVEENEPVATASAPASVLINDYSKQANPLMELAEELVRYFHQVFHGVTSHSPQSKETAQALSLISQYGLETSRRVIDFAREEAARTNYPVQHFGAVLSYASRAVASARRPEARPALKAVVPQPEERKRYVRGEERFEILTADQREARFEKAKSELLRQRPSLAQFWKLGSKAHESLVRSRVIRQLDSEPMGLVPFDLYPVSLYPWVGPTMQNLTSTEMESSAPTLS